MDSACRTGLEQRVVPPTVYEVERIPEKYSYHEDQGPQANVHDLRAISGRDSGAPVLVTGSRRRSTANRIARSRSSPGYFLGAAMTLILPWNESLHQTRHATARSPMVIGALCVRLR